MVARGYLHDELLRETAQRGKHLLRHFVASRVASADEVQLRTRPSPLEQPRDIGRAAEVQSAVDHDPRDTGQAGGVTKDLAVLEPRGIGEVVGAKTGKSHPEPGVLIARVGCPPRFQGQHGVFPLAPVLGCLGPDRRVGMSVEQPVVCSDEVLGVIAASAEARPLLGEDAPDLVVEPMDVGGPRHRHRNEHHLAHPLGMGLGIGEAEGDAPGPAPNEPAVDAEVLAEALDVGEEVAGRVRGQVRR